MKNGDKIIKIEQLIQEYLLSEGLLRERLPDPKSILDFGYIFSFPPGSQSQRMSTFKPKDKDFILISIRIQISESQISLLNSLEENQKYQFFNDLRKFLLAKEIYFQMDVINYRIEINEQLYINNDGIISKDLFFKTIRKIFYCYVYGNILLAEYGSGKENKSKGHGSDFDVTFYS